MSTLDPITGAPRFVPPPLLLEIEKILVGIDQQEGESDDGWWETSKGAEFGAKRLAEIRSLFLSAPRPVETPIVRPSPALLGSKEERDAFADARLAEELKREGESK